MSVAFPLSLSVDNRYLKDANGAPFLINSSSAWGLIAGLSLANAQAYVDARVAQGFNCLLVCLVVANNTIPPHTETWQNTINAFTTPGNYSTPNSAYFAHADDVITYCESKGVFVILNPLYEGWFGDPASGSWQRMSADTVAHLTSYGTFVGSRYASRSNVAWLLGGDQYAEFRDATVGRPPVAPAEQALCAALKAAAPTQFYTAHLDSSGDPVRYQDSGMHSYDGPEYRTYQAPPWGLNGHYAYAEQAGTLIYTRDRTAHALLVSGVPLPHFHVDESYETETNGTPLEIRTRQHRGMCEGCCGGAFNAGPIWYTDFNTSTGSTGQTENVHWWNFWHAMPWHSMSPDTSNAFVSATGRGTYGSSNYVCARASAERLVAHFPDGAGNTITVAMSQFNGAVRARWWDPTSGSYTLISASLPATGTQNFTNPGTNASGAASDWLLVLDTLASVSGRVFGPAQLSNVASTKYTVPALTTLTILRMRVSNPTVSAVTFTFTIGADAAGTRLYDAVSIPANGYLDLRGPFTLGAAEFFQAYGSSNGALVLTVDGTLKT